MAERYGAALDHSLEVRSITPHWMCCYFVLLLQLVAWCKLRPLLQQPSDPQHVEHLLCALPVPGCRLSFPSHATLGTPRQRQPSGGCGSRKWTCPVSCCATAFGSVWLAVRCAHAATPKEAATAASAGCLAGRPALPQQAALSSPPSPPCRPAHRSQADRAVGVGA